MNKWTLFALVLCARGGAGRTPFAPSKGSLPFSVHFASRYRGLCEGILVSRTAVMTAAVCVTNPIASIKDTSPINVIVGTTYRHPRRGIRVQVTKILIPNLKNLAENRGFMMQKSVAVLMLKRKVPDVLTEVPMRAIESGTRGALFGVSLTDDGDVDAAGLAHRLKSLSELGEEVLTLQEECMMVGWHFFYRGDKIYPVYKFLLQRNIRVQFLNIVKKSLWCEALSIKFQTGLTALGFHGYIDTGGTLCMRDPDRSAQPCHGMYGAPLICRGKAVAMLMAPDAQWTNCTGFSSLVHLLSSRWLRQFMKCASTLFDVEEKYDWEKMKKYVFDDYEEHDDAYIDEIYDRFTGDSSSSSDET